MVANTANMEMADIALREIIEGKMGFDVCHCYATAGRSWLTMISLHRHGAKEAHKQLHLRIQREWLVHR